MTVRAHHNARAFTLMELTVSLAVSAMLMAALGSAVAIAAAALPAENSPQTRVLDTSRALEHLSADLESAVYVLSTDATSPSFGIPDRDQDGAPDTQMLSWAGTRGDPILLVENGATPETVLDNATDYNSAFRTQSVSESVGAALVRSDEAELASYPEAPTLSGILTLHTGDAYGQIVTPELPDEVTSWTPTRVEFSLEQKNPVIGQVRAQIVGVDADGAPTEEVYSERVILESSLAKSLSWYSVDFEGAPALAPGQSICLVISEESGGRPCSFEIEDGTGEGLWYRDSWLLGTNPWQDDWSPWNMQMLYRVHGTYTAPGPEGSVTHHFATTVDLAIVATGNTDVDMDTTVNLVNRPQLVDSIWEAEFTTDPTLHDINADGIGDWARSSAGAFATGNLSGGVWDPRYDLLTQPPKDMTGTVIAEIEWQCTDSAQSGVMWTLTFDQSGGVQGNVTIHLAKANSSEQTLAMTTNDGAGTTNLLASVGGLPLEMIPVRVLIDPATDTALLTVNGDQIGAYQYLSGSYSDDERVSTLTPLGTGVRIDCVRIREGGTP